MTVRTHRQLANFIWSICNLLRGPYKRNEYRKVILPLTVLRRFDCLLEPTKDKVLKEHRKLKGKSQAVILNRMRSITGHEFYNLSKLDMQRLLDAPNELGPNLISYINGFSKNVRDIFDKFDFGVQIAKMVEKDLLYRVIQAFCDPKIDISPQHVDNAQMGYVFEELIRIGAEQANEEAGDHFTPREVIKLMVDLLLTPAKDLAEGHVVKKIYDPACGTGGMLSVAEQYIHELNPKAKPILYGQDWNDESWAVCTSDLLIKKEDPDNIKLADTFTKDGFDREKDGTKITFDYMLANPPFGVEWKQQQRFITQEHETLGYDGRFGAGLPRVNDGALLFLQHMLSKMQPTKKGGSRIGIVFNGSPLFTGDAGGGESNIRQWIFENDWLEAVVALPDQLFYNTGISTYIWILTNRKEVERKGKVQLIDARNFYIKMPKSLGNKRNKIGGYEEGEPDQIAEITRIYGDLQDGRTYNFTIEGKEKKLVVSKVFDNEDFGYHKITVERPLRINFRASEERIALLEEQSGFKSLGSSNKKNPKQRIAEIEAGKKRQQKIRNLLRSCGDKVYKNRETFISNLNELSLKGDAWLNASELKAVLAALGERDETAEICRDKDGNPESDPELRDTENVPLKEKIETYFKREVLPHVPDAWIDHEKTKIGYEIPFNRHFYVYEPPRPLDEIEHEIKTLEGEILGLLKEVAE